MTSLCPRLIFSKVDLNLQVAAHDPMVSPLKKSRLLTVESDSEESENKGVRVEGEHATTPKA